MANTIQTVLGPLDRDQVNGWVLPHEHLIIDLRTDQDRLGIVDQIDEVTKEIEDLHSRTDLALVVDQTCRGMGRDVLSLKQISVTTGVPIVAATGYYYQRFHPAGELDHDPSVVAEFLVTEIKEGIDDTGIRAGVLGELGTSGPDMTPNEETSLRAAALAGIETGTSLATHAHLSTGAIQQLEVLLSESVPTSRILIGHQDLVKSIDVLLPLLEKGVYIGFDTVGKNSYQPDLFRLEMLLDLLEKGWAKRILLSNDISRNPYLISNGGGGYAHVWDAFRPMLVAAGVDQNDLLDLYRNNALRWLTGEEGE